MEALYSKIFWLSYSIVVNFAWRLKSWPSMSKCFIFEKHGLQKPSFKICNCFLSTLLLSMLVPPVMCFRFLFWRYAVIGFSWKTCFSLFLTFQLLLFYTTFTIKLSEVWFYVRTKGVWNSFLFSVWIFYFDHWGGWIENLWIFLDSLVPEMLSLVRQDV